MTSTEAGAKPRDERDEVARPPGPSPSEAMMRMADPASAPWFMCEIEDTYPVLAHTVLRDEHAYVLTHPDAIVSVFIDHGRQTMKGHDLKGIEVDLGAQDREGEAHVRHRRLAQPAFHRDRLDEYSIEMTTRALEHQQAWREGATIDMQQSMGTLSLGIMGTTLFGTDMPIGTGTTQDTAAGLISALGPRMLMSHEPETPVEDRARGDMLSILLALQEDGFGFADAAARNQAITTLLGDPEPTAMNLTWAWILLGQHPECAEWLYEELDAALAGTTPCIEDMERLPRTRAVLAESMRLYPPAWLEGRRLLTDIDIDGWLLPAGSLALASQFALHRSERWWDGPSEFRPQRWLSHDGSFNEEAPGQVRGAWFPFGWGSRRCIGERFAWTEATLVLATLAQRWAPRPATESAPSPWGALTLQVATGARMTLHRR